MAKELENTGREEEMRKLRAQVAKAPTGPGIYRWRDSAGDILYVGKAKNLRNRLRNYVAPNKAGHGPWRQAFLKQIVDFDVTVTNTELEALMLETNLIKEMKPKYNVLMKDDKNYLYVRIDLRLPYPRIETVRKWQSDGAKYFGPYTRSEELNGILDLLRKLYGYRTCKMGIVPVAAPSPTATIPLQMECSNPDRPIPCLDHHIGQCKAPCIGVISAEQYAQECITPIIRYLQGDTAAAHALVQEKMKEAALQKQFELAAQYRDHIRVIQREQEAQLAIDATGEDADVLGVELLSERAFVVILHRRTGRIIGEAQFIVPTASDEISDILTQFITQFYSEHEVPPSILLSATVTDHQELQDWLTAKRGTNVKLLVPERGRKSHLVELAEKNARSKAEQEAKRWEAEEQNRVLALGGLQSQLKLESPPKRIEAYDISHFAGIDTVGSMVVAINGEASSDQYRMFTIKTLQEGEVDDYRSLQEVLRRRLKYFDQNVRTVLARLKADQITVAKARKADQPVLEALSTEHHIAHDDAAYGDYVVARKAEDIIGFCRMIDYEGIRTIRSLWVHPDYREHRLGHVLVRTLLTRAKKGKVYLACRASLTDYYAELGFQPVQTPPPVLEKKLSEWNQGVEPEQQMVIFVYIFAKQKEDPSLGSRPDLIVIDGGKGQLNAVCKVMKEMNIDLPIIGLAKREEEVFVPGRSDAIIFRQDSPAKFLLMRLRDEAHRFSNRHREKRAKASLTKSALIDIPGIGEKTMQELFKKFGSLAAAKAASDLELISILNQSQLAALRQHENS